MLRITRAVVLSYKIIPFTVNIYPIEAFTFHKLTVNIETTPSKAKMFLLNARC